MCWVSIRQNFVCTKNIQQKQTYHPFITRGTFFLVFRAVQGYQVFFVTALSWFVPSYCSWRPKYQICIATTRIKYNGWYPKVKLDFIFCYFTWRSLLFLFLGPMKYHCACEHSDESTYLRGYTGCVLPRPVLLEAALDAIFTKRNFKTRLLMERPYIVKNVPWT